MPALSRDVKDVALALCDGLSGPLSPAIKSCVEEERWLDLLAIEVSPDMYWDSESYFNDVACISFLRKYEPLPTGIDRKKVATDAFFEAELTCYRTNQRLLPFIHGTFGPEDEAAAAFIAVVRKEVEGIIGSRPPRRRVDLPNGMSMRVDYPGRFGPGSTFGDKGCLTTIPDKMSSSPTLTRDAWPFLFPWSGTLWGSACASRGESLVTVRGNRFSTVPKDCTKFRGICIEPSINLFYQLAFGQAMKDRLKSKGLHLKTAPDLHKLIARESSISGKYATIDLSQASDNLSSSLVKLVIPPMWFEPLNDLRSPYTEIVHAGVVKNVLLEKFSSMGNGYTFELETAIFMAICKAVYTVHGQKSYMSKNVFVFGDDIIVEAALAKDVLAALRFFGFKPNEKKTFLSGPFRESCGGDYFEGVDVRPYFLKELPSEPQDYIAMANGIRGMALKEHTFRNRWSDVRRAWFVALDSVPSNIRRCRGPKSLGDLVIHDEPEFWTTRTRSSIRYIKVWRPARFKKVGWDHFADDVVLAGACYGVPWGDGGVIPRDSVAGFKQGWVVHYGIPQRAIVA